MKNNVVADLVGKLKREMQNLRLQTFTGDDSPFAEADRIDWHARIDQLNLGENRWLSPARKAKLREILHRVADLTIKTGDRVVCVGKRIVMWLIDLLRRYSNTCEAVVITAGLVFVASNIPFLGSILVPCIKMYAVYFIGIQLVRDIARNLMGNIKLLN